MEAYNFSIFYKLQHFSDKITTIELSTEKISEQDSIIGERDFVVTS